MIGGASIIDMMILVIDINKGIQAQTAEVRGQRPFNPDRTIVQPVPTPKPDPCFISKKKSVFGYRRNYRYSYYFRAQQDRQS